MCFKNVKGKLFQAVNINKVNNLTLPISLFSFYSGLVTWFSRKGYLVGQWWRGMQRSPCKVEAPLPFLWPLSGSSCTVLWGIPYQMPPSQRENLQRVTFVFLLNTSHLPDTYFPPELSSTCVCSGNDVPGCRGKKQMQKNPLARENLLWSFPNWITFLTLRDRVIPFCLQILLTFPRICGTFLFQCPS